MWQARFEAMAEKNEASQKKQEEDVDSSLALLERLNQQNQTPQVAQRLDVGAASCIGRGQGIVLLGNYRKLFAGRTRRERTPKKKRHLSRSRSISAASVTSSSHRGKKARAKKRRDLKALQVCC